MMTPATVRLPIRHAFGVGDGRTLSVVNDMARKSPVIITITISNGVRIACPVMIRPTTRNSTVTIFLVIDVQRVGQDALERDPSFLDGGDDAAQARLGQHHAGGGFGDVGGRRDGDADLRLAQRRRVVGAVAAHADGVAAPSGTP